MSGSFRQAPVNRRGSAVLTLPGGAKDRHSTRTIIDKREASSAKQRAKRSLRERAAVTLNVVSVHCRRLRLSRLGLDRDRRAQLERGAEASIDVTLSEDVLKGSKTP